MAITRKLLKSMGIEEDKIEQIIEAHTETVNGLKDERDTYKASADKLADVQKELDALKANSGDDWKSKYDTLKKTFDDFKTETVNREKSEKVKAAYTELLKSANVDSKRIDAILKITDLSDKKLTEDGKLEGADELVNQIKSEWGAFIQTTGTKGSTVETPPKTTSTTMTKADIYAKDEHGRYKLSTQERQQALMQQHNTTTI